MTPEPADLEILRRLTIPGATVRSVAHEMGMTEAMAKTRLHRLYRRLGVNSALQAWARVTKVS